MKEDPLYFINSINRKLFILRGLIELLIHEQSKRKGIELIEEICDTDLANLTVMAQAGKLPKVKIES